MQRAYRKLRGFSLVELVIVIVIIGVIAAIAVPRLSRGAKGARDASLRGNLAVMRKGIELYAAEHGGNFPTAAGFKDMLTTYSDESGGTNATKNTQYFFGPYIKTIPGLPIAGITTTGGALGDTLVAAIDAADVGWIYLVATGDINANTGTAADEAGTLYSAY